MSRMEEFHKVSIDGMKAMNMDMMLGMVKKDPDVAFARGMIAYHMAAVSMSLVELKYGDNAQLQWSRSAALCLLMQPPLKLQEEPCDDRLGSGRASRNNSSGIGHARSGLRSMSVDGVGAWFDAKLIRQIPNYG